jgi:hypothetical protein
MKGIKLFLELFREIEETEKRVRQSGEAILDTNDLLQNKIKLAEILIDLEYTARENELTEEEKEQIRKGIFRIRERYKIQSGIYVNVELRRGNERGRSVWEE